MKPALEMTATCVLIKRQVSVRADRNHSPRLGVYLPEVNDVKLHEVRHRLDTLFGAASFFPFIQHAGE